LDRYVGENAEREVAVRCESWVNNKDISAHIAMHRKRPLLVAAFFVYCVVIHLHHDSNSRFVGLPDKLTLVDSTGSDSDRVAPQVLVRFAR